MPMNDPDLFTIHTDGGARGNPGPAAYAFVISRPGQADVEESGTLGTSTNNVAEYTALAKALQRAREVGGRRSQPPPRRTGVGPALVDPRRGRRAQDRAPLTPHVGTWIPAEVRCAASARRCSWWRRSWW